MRSTPSLIYQLILIGLTQAAFHYNTNKYFLGTILGENGVKKTDDCTQMTAKGWLIVATCNGDLMYISDLQSWSDQSL